MLDFELAELYGVETKALNQAVTRNNSRFPKDFMFRFTREELGALNRSQSVTGSQRHRDPRHPPRAFTQEGVAMLSGVLRSKRAIQVNVAIMRAFVRLRNMLMAHQELRVEVDALERRVENHDVHIATVFKAIRELMAPSTPKKTREIGFGSKS